MALGISERSLELALAYAQERTQFGQPIASFQAVQLRLARMYASQESVRSLLEGALRRAGGVKGGEGRERMPQVQVTGWRGREAGDETHCASRLPLARVSG